MRRLETEAILELSPLAKTPLLVEWAADGFETCYIWLRAFLFGGIDSIYQKAGLPNALRWSVTCEINHG